MRSFYAWSLAGSLPNGRVVEASDVTSVSMPVSAEGLRQYVVRRVAAEERCAEADLAVTAFSFTEIPAAAAPRV